MKPPPQSRLYCLCINVALCSTALQCICRVIRRSSMTMKAHTYYIIFGRPPMGGSFPPPPWRRNGNVRVTTVINASVLSVDTPLRQLTLALTLTITFHYFCTTNSPVITGNIVLQITSNSKDASNFLSLTHR